MEDKELRGWNEQLVTMRELGIPFRIGQRLRILTREEAMEMNIRLYGVKQGERTHPRAEYGWCPSFEKNGGKEIEVTKRNYSDGSQLSFSSANWGTDMFFLLEDVEETNRVGGFEW